MPARAPKRRPPGRPPAGAHGEMVRDYPQLSIRVPPDVKMQLQALSLIRSEPQWRIVSEAVQCYLDLLPASDREAVRQLGNRRRR